VVILAAAVLALGGGAAESHAAGRDTPITLTFIANSIQQPAFDVLIPNFERVYPNITVNAVYEPTTVQYQLTTVELQAGNAPDLITSWPGCGTVISVCLLAKEGHLAPMVGVPWTRLSSPLVISASKYSKGLFVYSPSVSFRGVFTDDTLFRKLGLAVPQTFPQLLAVCRQAKTAGTVAFLTTSLSNLVLNFALTTVYANDSHWGAELRAGKVSFEGTPGWHEALQEFVDMIGAGCFEPGAATDSAAPAALNEFAQGQALMVAALSSNRGLIAAASPQFAYTQHPVPNGSAPGKTLGYITLGSGPAVNAHSPAAKQVAAQLFVNFVARPKQDALDAELNGGLSQYEFIKGQVPAYMSSFGPLLAAHEYALDPSQNWWNPDVLQTLTSDVVGLFTGQTTIDGILKAMDAAWQEGPS
jgi:raffinose/stachyose/melibiose transport system substrate-binding protein